MLHLVRNYLQWKLILRNAAIKVPGGNAAKGGDALAISGKGKRIKETDANEPAFLDPIRFRYSTEAVVEEPEVAEIAEAMVQLAFCKIMLNKFIE